MIITYFRSSSYSQFQFCQQSYYITYVLGVRGGSNRRAELGTMVHKVMECLAWWKKCKQDGLEKFDDEALGTVYLTDCNINSLAERSFQHYSAASPQHEWTSPDLKIVKDWSWQAVTMHDGRFDPRKRKIVDPERRFDFVIDKPWAHYKYETPNGVIEGQLALKGTIDLITEVSPGVIEIIDWKTGRRIDWGTGEIKDFKKLCSDPQLMIYHYAARKLYPDAKQIMITINFMNDHGRGKDFVPGGAYTIVFHRSDILRAEMMLAKRFKTIRNTVRPRLNKSWRCKSFCYFGRNNWPDTDKTMCEHIKDELILKGPDYVVENYTAKGHSVDYYEAPG